MWAEKEEASHYTVGKTNRERETIVEHENNLERDYDYVIGTVEIDYRARRVISLVKLKFIFLLKLTIL